MSNTSVSILDQLDQLAVIAGGMFAGTALYVTVTEVPAIRAIGLDEHWRFFPQMYKRAALQQGICTIVATAASIIHSTRITDSSLDRRLWFISGAVFASVIPYTFLCITPVNSIIIYDNQLIDSGKESQIDTTTRKTLLDKWATLHSVRSICSTVAFGLMVYGLSRRHSLTLG
jgi:hypothetical protein